MIAVSFRNVTKTFPRHSGQQLIQQHVKRLFSRTLEPPVPFCALRDISFEVPRAKGWQ